MAKSGKSMPFWSESALQTIYHIDNMCRLANEGRGVWIPTPALQKAMSLSTFGKYHRELLAKLVDGKMLEHKQVGRLKTHYYKLTDTGKSILDQRFADACAKCQIEQNALF